MFTRFLAAAGLTLTLLQVPALAAGMAPDGKDKAADACQAMNEYGPVKVIANVDDGMGDWLVWVKDKDGDLWMCNANAHGAVFTNVLMQGDLLKGDGSQLMGLRNVADNGTGDRPGRRSAVHSHRKPHREDAGRDDRQRWRGRLRHVAEEFRRPALGVQRLGQGQAL